MYPNYNPYHIIMKKSKNTIKVFRETVLVLIAVFSVSFSFGQIRIDWQQCYGTYGLFCYETATSILPVEDGFLVFGTVDRPQNPGMVLCDVENTYTPWLIRIDRQGELIDQQCWEGLRQAISIREVKTNSHEYFINTHRFGEVTILKIDAGFNEIWRREMGYFGSQMLPTADGGVLVGCSYGLIGKGNGEDSLLKLDNLGNVAWKISVGMDVRGISQAKDGGFFVVGTPQDGGAALIKMSQDGQMEWVRTYETLNTVIELDDGYMLASTTDIEGEGSHGENDILLARTDMDGNILWSRYYGGTNYDNLRAIYPNLNGGFTILALSGSRNGDVQSNSNGNGNTYHLWIFNIDPSGLLLWERCIGSYWYSEEINSIAKIGNYKYVVAGSLVWEETPSGDVYCSNNQILPDSGHNYWVLQVTDTINSAGVAEPLAEERAMCYPNPSNGMVRIQGMEPAEVQVYDVMGQRVKCFHGTNEIPLGDLPKGMYLIKAVLKDGKTFSDKVVKE